MLDTGLQGPDGDEPDGEGGNDVDDVVCFHARHRYSRNQPTQAAGLYVVCMLQVLSAAGLSSVRRQIVIPAELDRRLRATAAARGIGFSTLVRMLLLASYEKAR
jgi:hypothetical protein